MNYLILSRRLAGVAAIAVTLCMSSASLVLAQAEGSFERTLKVTGAVDLSVQSGSGRIHVQPGAGGTVTVSAKLRASAWSWTGGDPTARIRDIEKNPPIEQAGNTIRIGRFADEERQRNISISYEITVPAETSVNARTGSGSVEIGDLGGSVDATSGSGSITLGRIRGAAVARTGSGSIDVNGAASLEAQSGSGGIKGSAIGGPVKARTGSGGVRLAQTGKGEVEVSSSSGEVFVTGVNGPARVSASSGGIVVEGRPTGPWKIDASSGGITLRLPADAAFDLDAHVSSGRIDSAHPVTVSGSIDKHRLQGKVRGGGPLVDVHTSSGGIRIQ